MTSEARMISYDIRQEECRTERGLTRVNKVVHQGEEDQENAGRKEARSNNGDNPMDAGPVGPRKPEQTNGNQDGAENGGRQTSFRGGSATGRLGSDVVVSLVVKEGSNGRKGHADGNANEGKTANARAPATNLLEDNGEGGKAHVQSAVDDGHVEGDEKDDGLLDEKLPGSQEGNAELAANRLGWLSRIELGNEDLARPLAQSGGALAEQDGSIRLPVDQRAGNPDNTGEDGNQALHPSPALGLSKEATCNWSYSHSQH